MLGLPKMQRIIGKIRETASVMPKTESAARYLPMTICVTLTGAVSKSWSVRRLRSKDKRPMVRIDTKNR